MVITANEIKKHGVSIIDQYLKDDEEVIISHRGKKKYLLMSLKEGEEFRAHKLDKAYKEVMQDIKNGDYHTDINRHLKEIANV
jgi:PHD/YefM family antitoxin component YafN of YafNO toxin-antitoxin module